jgi:TorA maturation chaperone TorD
MSGEAIPPRFPPYVEPEDEARAEFYALLSRLWYAAPDRALLQAIAEGAEVEAEGEQRALADAWRELRAAAAETDPEAARNEYDTVFVGTGRAEVSLYASHYLVDTAKERVLVALRDELLELGLARAEGAHEPEDHMAALFEVMRHLIENGSEDAALRRQKKFFTAYMGRAYNPLTERVMASTKTSFYRYVARFMKAFCDIEAASLEML